MSFQYIEGTDGKYFAHDGIDQITEFLAFAYAKILTASNLEETKIDEYFPKPCTIKKNTVK